MKKALEKFLAKNPDIELKDRKAITFNFLIDPTGKAGMRHYRMEIGAKGEEGEAKQAGFNFSTGSGWKRVPDLYDVLECLISDANTLVGINSFKEWAPELGYDSDSIHASKIYKAVKQNTQTLKNLLGEDRLQEMLELEYE